MPKCDFNKAASGVSEAKLKVEENASDKKLLLNYSL